MSSQAFQAEYFRSRKEAHDWLIEQRYAVSIGKFYQDIKEKGFPVLNPDKTVSKYQVAVYGKSLENAQQPDPSALERLEAMHRKERAEAEIAEMKAERMRREEDAEWLHSSLAWSVVAGLIGNLRDVVRRHLHDAQIDIAKAAGGDIARAPEVYEAVDQVISQAWNEVAGSELQIQWEGEE
ncbi:hypothetical protein [Desulfobulbus sp.]|uniref:hypothetical protein n=1 Tax=Desulfobulbus sp. TaxID=895 RepID=UPI00286F9514|nr:hypothetical protein [Desulfobulbus sp.]